MSASPTTIVKPPPRVIAAGLFGAKGTLPRGDVMPKPITEHERAVFLDDWREGTQLGHRASPGARP